MLILRLLLRLCCCVAARDLELCAYLVSFSPCPFEPLFLSFSCPLFLIVIVVLCTGYDVDYDAILHTFTLPLRRTPTPHTHMSKNECDMRNFPSHGHSCMVVVDNTSYSVRRRKCHDFLVSRDRNRHAAALWQLGQVAICVKDICSGVC